jgi:pimeloyl-ACP methyl ester carboxylesterase
LFAGPGESAPESLRSEVRHSIQSLQSETLSAVLQAIGNRKDYTFLLKNLKIPTLLIGAENDPITHHKHTDLIANQLPNCYRSVKLNGGHLVNMEKVQEFNRVLLDFLADLAPRKQRTMIMPLRLAV